MIGLEKLLLVWHKLALLLHMRILQIILQPKIFNIVLLIRQILKRIIIKFFRLGNILDNVDVVAIFVLDHLAGKLGGKFANGGTGWR